MTAGRYDLLIEQGATFYLPFEYLDSTDQPIDLTLWTARLQARRKAVDAEVIVEMTTENGRITLGGTAGTIDLSMLADDTTLLQPGEYLYDLELVSSGSVDRVMEGRLTISPEITK
jgi:hypothetical protein